VQCIYDVRDDRIGGIVRLWLPVLQEHGGHFQHGGQIVFARLAFTLNQHRQPGAAGT
jgi:hypothetical protein